MSNKLQKRVNGGLAIYFGIGSLITSVMLVVALLVLTYRVIFMQDNSTWGVFIFIILAILASGGFAYALLRIGYEEIEN
ncbi:hypothetical protein [Marivirga sp.]|uniref:hypothetical protein n=1 Tax=Marivirga sp. TaxID=2018662 RepID=UPI002D7FC2EA|nr:hypothetical protein [Marivirga sp.]HET8859390.1 hypothetical protein [Marivirga sp.]